MYNCCVCPADGFDDNLFAVFVGRGEQPAVCGRHPLVFVREGGMEGLTCKDLLIIGSYVNTL